MKRISYQEYIQGRRVTQLLLCRKKSFIFLFLVLIAFWIGVENSPLFSVPAWAAEKGGKPVEWSTAIIQVARQAIPAVVHIEVTARQEVANPMLPFENDPFFRRFFNVPKMPKKFKRELKGLGSGIIVDAQGHILTNNHVVDGADEVLLVEIEAPDRHLLGGELVGELQHQAVLDQFGRRARRAIFLDVFLRGPEHQVHAAEPHQLDVERGRPRQMDGDVGLVTRDVGCAHRTVQVDQDVRAGLLEFDDARGEPERP